MEYKISVIIPCYNVEKYIDRCVTSIINQTIGIENLQVLFVNDVSPDHVGEHLLKYEQQYPDNICIINLEKNGGLSNARNVGMQYALADYVTFVDSDDWVELDMYEKMYNKAINGNYDIIICDSDRVSSEEKATSNRNGEDEYFELDSVEKRRNFIKNYRLNVMAWNKLYKASLFTDNGIEYPKGLLYEDNYATMLLYMKANKIYHLKKVMYHWFINGGSITRSNKGLLDRVKVQKLLLQRLRDEGLYEIFKDEIDYNCFEKLLAETAYSISLQGEQSLELIINLKETFLQLIPDIEKNIYYNKKEVITEIDIQYISHFIIERKIDLDFVTSLRRKYLYCKINFGITELLKMVWEIKNLIPYLTTVDDDTYNQLADCIVPIIMNIKDEIELISDENNNTFNGLSNCFKNKSRNTNDIMNYLFKIEDIITNGTVNAAIYGIGLQTQSVISKYYPMYIADHTNSNYVGKYIYDFKVEDIDSIIDKVDYIIIGDALYASALEAHIQNKYKNKKIKVINPFKFNGYYNTTEIIRNDYTKRNSYDSEEEFNKQNENCYNIGPVNAYVDQVFENVQLFKEVEIETVNRCNGVCEFCPVNKTKDNREYHVMSDDLYRNIINQLADINYSGLIAPFSNNEPFLDDKIIERTKYMREMLPNARIHLYTNGTLLTLDRFKAIIQYLDELIVDNYHHELKLLETSKIIRDYCESNTELKKKVTIVIRDPKEILSSRGGDAPNRKNLKSFSECKCALPYQQLIIRPDGKISLCCNDPLGKNTLGDLNKEKILDVWYGEKYNEVRKALQNGRKGWKHCEFCDSFYMY